MRVAQRGPRDRPRPPDPHGLRALRAARGAGGLRRARHRHRRGRRCRRRSRARRRRRPRAPSTRPSASGRGLERGGGKAVVIGAGYIGLEMAENLVDRGMAVTVIDQGDQVMRTLDRDMAAHVQDGAEAHGVRLPALDEIEEIAARRRRAPARRADERGRAARRPRHARDRRAARRAPRARTRAWRSGETGALRVDDHQRCPDVDGVYAAGDCVESHHRVLDAPVNIQLGTHANKQGRIAGSQRDRRRRRASRASSGPRSRRSASTRSPAPASPRPRRSRPGIEVVQRASSRTRRARATTPAPARSGSSSSPTRAPAALLGGQIVGVEGAAKRIDVLAACVWTGLAVDEIALMDLSYAPPYSPVYDPVLVAARAAAKVIESARRRRSPAAPRSSPPAPPPGCGARSRSRRRARRRPTRAQTASRSRRPTGPCSPHSTSSGQAIRLVALVGLVELAVERRARAVVLADRVDHRRVAQRAPVLRERLGGANSALAALEVEALGVAGEQALGEVVGLRAGRTSATSRARSASSCARTSPTSG